MSLMGKKKVEGSFSGGGFQSDMCCVGLSAWMLGKSVNVPGYYRGG